MLRALWRYRGLIGGMVRRELQMRSLRAAWGRAWLVIQPALQILIYTLIFSRVLGAKLPGVSDGMAYSFYLCAGLLPWEYFSEIVRRGQTIFIENASILKAVRFPRTALPIALVASASVQFAIITAVLLVVLAVTGRWPGAVLLGALPVVALLAVLALGLGLLGGVFNVFYRDVGHAVGIGLQFWFWLTPIVYPLAIVPERGRELLAWNPLFPVMSAFHGIVVEARLPDYSELAPVALLALASLGAAWAAFRALGSDLVDEL